MKIIHLETVDSTLTYARSLIKKHQKSFPFVVWSDTQTKGKGQKQKIWHSPKGNAYLTFAFKPSFFDLKSCYLLPCYTSLVLVKVLNKLAGITPLIKWPNDLLIEGKKLGGILCEASTSGDQLNYILLGVGINLKSAPDLDKIDDSSNIPISLSELLLESSPILKNLDTFIEQLINEFSTLWQNCEPKSLESFLKEYESHLIPKNQVFNTIENGIETPWLHKGLSSEGNIIFENSLTKEKKELVTPEQNFRWCYQKPLQSPFSLLLLDIGNSAFKAEIKEFSKDQIKGIKREVIPLFKDIKKDLPYIKKWLSATNTPIYCSYFASVANEDESYLKGIFSNLNIPLITVPKRWVRVKSSVYSLDQMGSDRFAMIEGSLTQKSWQYREKIIVSMGTATTIDFMDDHNHHLGGFILSGIESKLNSLHQKTADLPLVNPSRFKTLMESLVKNPEKNRLNLGSNTEEAIAYGALEEWKSMILEFSDQRFRTTGKSPLIILTGGLSPLFKNFITCHQTDSLVTSGIASIILGGYTEKTL